MSEEKKGKETMTDEASGTSESGKTGEQDTAKNNDKGDDKEKHRKKGKSGEDFKSVFDDLGDSVGKLAEKTVETIKDAFDKSVGLKNTVVTLRVTDKTSEKLSMLVDAGIFKSRSESAAFLIDEGIKHREDLFKKIHDKMDAINKIKDELKDVISKEDL
jgi:Arc/MetJ-type ribon-helix-helix transcriptional regulator